MSGHHAGLDYGRRLVHSGLQGARNAQEQFLEREQLKPYLNESAQAALTPALIGACVGVIGSRPRSRNNSPARVLAFAMFGCLLGFTVGLAWESRRLTASLMCGARKGIGKVRDEHWLENHPIDYA